MNFNFLKTAAKDVGKAASGTLHFLENVVPGGAQIQDVNAQAARVKQQVDSLPTPVRQQILSNPEAKASYDKISNPISTPGESVVHGAVDITRAIPREVLSVGASLHDILAPADQKVGRLQISNPAAKAVLGDGEIQTLQKRQQGAEKTVAGSRFRAGALPLSFLGVGLSSASNLLPLGKPEEAVGKEIFDQVAKAATESEVKKILVDKIAPGVAERLAPALAKTKDPNIVRNLLDKGVEKTPQVISDIAPLTNPTGASNPVENVVNALREGGIKNLQEEQKALYTKGRATQLSRASAARQGLTGEEALNATFGGYKVGELPRVNATKLSEHVQSLVDEPTYVQVLNQLQNGPSLAGFDASTAAEAWRSFYRNGKLPTPSEFKLLEKGAGTDFANTIATTAVDSLDTWQKVKNFGVQALGMPKALLASFDFSGGGRQGAVLGSRFSKIWGEAQRDSVKAFASSDFYKNRLTEIAEHIESSPRRDIYKNMDLNLAKPGGLAHEEAFTSTLAEKIPIAGKGVAASDRAYTLGLNQQRFQTADHILDTLEENGFKINQNSFLGIKHGGDVTHDLGDLSLKAQKDLGKFIKTASGRGDLGSLEKHAQSLGEALFSPRLWKSRLDMLNPVYYAKLDGPAQKLALQSAGSFAAIASVILGLAVAAGAKVETDARSSDFLKIKKGDTRYDILGGFQQNLVFAHRELVGQKKNSTTGAISDLTSGKYGSADRLSILSDLIKNKENPVISTGQTLLKGTDKSGNPVNKLTTIGNLFVPLNIQDTYKTAKNTGSLPQGLLKATLPGTVGVGVNTYGLQDIQPTTKQKAYIQQLQTSGAPKEQLSATKEFYQTLKTGPDRAKASADVNKALAAGDTQKAQDIANTYNKQYAQTFTQWAKKNSGYTSDTTLIKDYNKGQIKLTTGNIKTRVKSIKNNPLYNATLGQ